MGLIEGTVCLVVLIGAIIFMAYRFEKGDWPDNI